MTIGSKELLYNSADYIHLCCRSLQKTAQALTLLGTMPYVYLFLAVLGAALIPAFGPPSWIFAVYFYHRHQLAFVAVVTISSLATASGRLLLALLTRKSRRWLPARYNHSLDYARRTLLGKKKSVWLSTGVFLLSPLPSAQLFEAAAFLDLPLFRLTGAFLIGRLITTSIYLGVVSLSVVSLQKAWEAGFSSPLSVGTEVIALGGIILLFTLRHWRQK